MEIKKIDLESLDIKQEKISKIKEIFPEIFNEDKIDLDKLKISLGEEIDNNRERFGMNWPGKTEAIRVAQRPSTATLKPVKSESVNFDKTNNLFIEGDNLEVLKLLQKSYFGAVKMIYIDPPYNTGKEFIYPDKFSDDMETYLQYTGQIDANGKKFTTNTETDGRYHSKWMNMMWSRLFLARNLLTDNGVIFISIGEEELSNLIAILNEIFGEENKVGLVTRIQKRGGNKGNYFNPVSDYICVYAKDINNLNFFTTDVDEKIYNKTETEGARKGCKYAEVILYMPNLDYRPNQRFFVTAPDGVKIIPPENKSFRWSRERFESELSLGNVTFKKTAKSLLIDENGNQAKWIIYQKRFLIDTLEKESARPNNLFENFQNMTGSKDLIDLGIPFDYPKPVELIKHILKISKIKKDDIVLDFFAGSATTAHAVMKLNIEDGENRKFIMIQLPEAITEDSEAHKFGFKNIAQIGEERIRRAGNKLVEENKNKKEHAVNNFDFGFKVYKLSQSNFTQWDSENNSKIQEKLQLHVNNINSDSENEDILYELLLKSGYSLTDKIEEFDVNNKKIYSIAEGSLIICLEKGLNKEIINEIAIKKPKLVICLNSSFINDSDLTNAAKIMENNQIEFRTV